jgi:hypothetical protein
MKENIKQMSMKWGFHYNQMRKQEVSNGAHTFVHGLLVDGVQMKMETGREIVCGTYALQNLTSCITENSFPLCSWEEFPGFLYCATSKQ